MFYNNSFECITDTVQKNIFHVENIFIKRKYAFFAQNVSRKATIANYEILSVCLRQSQKNAKTQVDTIDGHTF